MTKSWFFTSTPILGTTHSSNCTKDAKNGFFSKFYIDIVNRKIFQLFFSIEKIFFGKWKKQNLKMQNSFRDFDFSLVKFSITIFQKKYFFDYLVWTCFSRLKICSSFVSRVLKSILSTQDWLIADFWMPDLKIFNFGWYRKELLF